MKDRGPADTTSGPIFGRELIILLVVVFSGLSFTLGFFVGKNAAPEPAGNMQPVENMQTRKQEVIAAQPVQQPLQSAEQQLTSQPVPIPPVQPEEKKPSPLAEQQRPEQKDPAKQQTTKADPRPEKEAPVRSPGKAEEKPENSEKKASYTVQLGAFKNPADARHIKARVEKKGYKVSISAEKDSKGHKVYKVRTGEYKDKKEAEVLALKLKKTEDLHTYVTTKAD